MIKTRFEIWLLQRLSNSSEGCRGVNIVMCAFDALDSFATLHQPQHTRSEVLAHQKLVVGELSQTFYVAVLNLWLDNLSSRPLVTTNPSYPLRMKYVDVGTLSVMAYIPCNNSSAPRSITIDA